MNELAAPFAVSLPAISRHLEVLERAGLIARSREAQSRPSPGCRLRRSMGPWTGCNRASGYGMPGWIDSTRTCANKEGDMTDSLPTTPADQLVLITRVFDAPRERVFRAWTDPDEVAAWYGPEHMDTPRERIKIDLRVGGRYELTMVQRGGGAEFTIVYEIIELAEPRLIVLRSEPMPEMGMPEPVVLRVEFHDHGEKTRMTLSDGPYPSGRGHAEAGWNAAFDKLAALVTQ